MNGPLPTFSIVVAAYNSAATIGETLESVRRQSRRDWELIVVDDRSHDETAAVAESFADPRIRIVHQPRNLGPGAARNRGISLARAPLVCTLDSDDLWLPSYLATMGRALDANPGATVACTDAWVLDAATGRVRKTSVVAPQDPPEPIPEDTQALLHELLRRNFIYNSVTARRETLLGVGGYDERLRVGEDWELWLRLGAAGVRFVRVPELLAVYRARADSLTGDPRSLLAASREVYRIVAEERTLNEELRELVVRLNRQNELHLLAAPILRPLLALREKFRKSGHWREEPPREVAELLAVVSTRQHSLA